MLTIDTLESKQAERGTHATVAEINTVPIETTATQRKASRRVNKSQRLPALTGALWIFVFFIRGLAPCPVRSSHLDDHSNYFCEAWRSTTKKPLTCVLKRPSRIPPWAPVSNSRLIFRICLGSSGCTAPGKAALLRPVRALYSLDIPVGRVAPRGGGQHTHLVSHSIAILSKASKRTHSLNLASLTSIASVWAFLTRSFVLSGRHQQGPAGQHRILDQIPCLSSA
jgi:hypothetical protein